MKLVFYSNFLNDHQLPLCLEFIKLLGEGNFFFVAHQEISQERLDLRFEDMNEKYPFVIKAYKNKQEENLAQRLMIEADVVIIGSYRNMPFEKRMELNKLTFRYNERILKRGDLYWFDPRLHYNVFKSWTKYKYKNLYTLCASAYTSRDLSLFGYPRNKCLKWGYFPEVRRYTDLREIFKIKELNNLNLDAVPILWVGRLIKCKHPEHAIIVAKLLKKEGYRFKLNIIGVGEMYNDLLRMIEEYNLREDVSMLGALTPADVRKQMEASKIYLFTSDRNEGWGAVLNESLNSACAVVANREIGSVPFLLRHGVNGLIYNGEVWDLYKKVRQLFVDNNLIQNLGLAGYNTITEQWDARSAAQKFISLTRILLDNAVLTLS